MNNLKTIEVNWDDFESAFIIGSPDARYFIHASSGEVEYISHMDGEVVRERLERKTESPDWIEIQRPTQDDAMTEIRQFIEAETNTDTVERLANSLSETRPFVAFNRAMGSDVELRRRWSTARMAGIHQRLMLFCSKHGFSINDERFTAIKLKFSS